MEENFFVFTALGRDRVGMVDDISSYLESAGCNILESRMAVLGGEFAVIMLVSASEEDFSGMKSRVDSFAAEMDFILSIKETSRQQNAPAARPYALQVYSIDAPGIVHAVTSVLHRFGINIADLKTDTSPAPWTGTPMFQLRADILVPAGVSQANLRDAFAPLEEQKDLDIILKPFAAQGLE